MAQHGPSGRTPPALDSKDLRRLLLDSRLEPALKRQWLRVLPHLAPEHLAKLQEVLRETPPEGSGEITPGPR